MSLHRRQDVMRRSSPVGLHDTRNVMYNTLCRIRASLRREWNISVVVDGFVGIVFISYVIL